MAAYRYELENYSGPDSRYMCPACKKSRVFTRYIDNSTGELLPDIVGRCSREKKCGYHYPPRQYLLDNQPLAERYTPFQMSSADKSPTIVPKAISFIPHRLYAESLGNYKANWFHEFLFNLFGKNITNRVITKYSIGTSDFWPGSTIFWQIDLNGCIRTGKIMQYDSLTGRRIKEESSTSYFRNHIDWVHSILKRNGSMPQFNLQQCFFGEHLLNHSPQNVIAIVESEKTAIISSIYFPKFTWLACGSLNGLSVSKCKVLEGRKIILFPDLNCLPDWEKKAVQIGLSIPCKIKVSTFLENRAPLTDKLQGLDLADYLIRRDEKFGWALTEIDYPIFWDQN